TSDMAEEPMPKLRMAPRESAEELAQRYEREHRAAQLQREDRLSQSLAPFRVGSVPYLNAAPLTRGLEEEMKFVVPSELGKMLRAGELDAALLSITEVLLNNSYDVLDGIAIASLGEVKSVFLAHREPIEKIQTIHCDTASLTSVNLLRVLLAERGLKPEFKPLPSYEAAKDLPNVLLIGNAGIDFLRAGHPHEIWDLGAAWFEITQLPFVYAVWALRRGIENSELKRQLREAKAFGLDTLDHIINTRPEFDLEFRKDYLGWHIHFHLGTDEKRGIARFVELLRKHHPGPVYDPQFVV
ncbi:MAG TPA: menaquinone biosynthesis protein, partial [Verrucomicrobiae bacterium]|nr:menaquinone biosynthesis protein [Verrucomicrobiae bacterium]